MRLSIARPTKQNLDYFPLDTAFDDRVELFVAENGAAGLGVLITTWQLVYGGHGYYVEFNTDLLLLIRRRLLLDIERIKAILEAAVKREIFSLPQKEEHSILTSKAIQSRYLIAARKKKAVNVVRNYL